jgi:hypothetical protein
LRRWVDESRDALRHHQRLTEAANAWAELRHDPDALYRGSRLAVVRDWDRDDLNQVEGAFLEASIERADAEAAAKARNHRRLWLLAAELAIALVAAVAAGVVWLNQRRARSAAARDRGIPAAPGPIPQPDRLPA